MERWTLSPDGNSRLMYFPPRLTLCRKTSAFLVPATDPHLSKLCPMTLGLFRVYFKSLFFLPTWHLISRSSANPVSLVCLELEGLLPPRQRMPLRWRESPLVLSSLVPRRWKKI